MASFALIHGAWHGAWCWSRVLSELTALGHDARAVDLPIDRPGVTTADYADAAAAAFAGDAPPVVVAHSMAGLVAPLVADRLAVRGLVYLAALLRRPGHSLAEDRADGLNGDISPPGFGKELQRDADGLTYWPSAAAVTQYLYQDASKEDAAWVFTRLRHQKGYWSDRAPQADWPSVASAAIVCTDDRAVTPGWSHRMLREWLGIEPFELPGGHSPYLTRPRELASLLDRLARTTFA